MIQQQQLMINRKKFKEDNIDEGGVNGMTNNNNNANEIVLDLSNKNKIKPLIIQSSSASSIMMNSINNNNNNISSSSSSSSNNINIGCGNSIKRINNENIELNTSDNCVKYNYEQPPPNKRKKKQPKPLKTTIIENKLNEDDDDNDDDENDNDNNNDNEVKFNNDLNDEIDESNEARYTASIDEDVINDNMLEIVEQDAHDSSLHSNNNSDLMIDDMESDQQYHQQSYDTIGNGNSGDNACVDGDIMNDYANYLLPKRQHNSSSNINNSSSTTRLNNNKSQAQSNGNNNTNVGKKQMRFQCKFCTYRSHSVSLMQNHIYRHIDTTPYSCYYCGHKSTTKSTIMVHIELCHPNMDVKIKENRVKEEEYYLDLNSNSVSGDNNIPASKSVLRNANKSSNKFQIIASKCQVKNDELINEPCNLNANKQFNGDQNGENEFNKNENEETFVNNTQPTAAAAAVNVVNSNGNTLPSSSSSSLSTTSSSSSSSQSASSSCIVSPAISPNGTNVLVPNELLKIDESQLNSSANDESKELLKQL